MRIFLFRNLVRNSYYNELGDGVICGASIKDVICPCLKCFIPWITHPSKIQDGESLFFFSKDENENLDCGYILT